MTTLKPALKANGLVNIRTKAGQELIRQAVADYEAAWKQAATNGDMEDKRKFNRSKKYLEQICPPIWMGYPDYTGDPTLSTTRCALCGEIYHPYFELGPLEWNL